MNWIAGIGLLALLALVIAVASDISMTKCTMGSAYAVLRFCTPAKPR